MGYNFTRYHYTYETYARVRYVILTRYGSCWYCDTGKVEAKLNEQGITRYDLGRESFRTGMGLEEEYASFIRAQWAKLGLGLDYSRERFTLDEGLSKAVKKFC